MTFVLHVWFRPWKPAPVSSVHFPCANIQSTFSVSTGRMPEGVLRSSTQCSSLLYTQVVWLCCKPESRARVSPLLRLQGNVQGKQSTHWPSPRAFFRYLLAFSLSCVLLRKGQKHNTCFWSTSTAGSFQGLYLQGEKYMYIYIHVYIHHLVCTRRRGRKRSLLTPDRRNLIFSSPRLSYG